MATWKKLLKALLFPHAALLALLVPTAAVLLIYALRVAGAENPVSFAIFARAFYVTVAFVIRIPNMVRFARRVKRENKYVARYFADVQIRVKMSLATGLISSAVYTVFQLGLGLYHRSVWFYAMAVYYFLLALMRFFLLRHAQRHMPGENIVLELKKTRFCGFCLLFMNTTLSTIIFYITWQNRTFYHHPITVIAMAAYTFGAFTVSIVNMIKYRKYQSPVYSTAKTISLISASVSMLTLETAMLTAFDEANNEVFRRIMNGGTGAAVTILVLWMAVRMITKSTIHLRELKQSEE